MKYPDFIEKIIIEKNYNQLTTGEKAQVGEWIASEQEYNSIKNILAGIDMMATASPVSLPPPAIKQSLQHTFAGKHKRAILKRRLAYTFSGVAASVIIFLSLWVLFNDNSPQEKKVVQNVPPAKEKQIPAPPPQNVPPQQTPKAEPKTHEGSQIVMPEIIEDTEEITPILTEDAQPDMAQDMPAAVFHQSVPVAYNKDLAALTVTVF